MIIEIIKNRKTDTAAAMPVIEIIFITALDTAALQFDAVHTVFPCVCDDVRFLQKAEKSAHFTEGALRNASLEKQSEFALQNPNIALSSDKILYKFYHKKSFLSRRKIIFFSFSLNTAY